MLAYLFLGFSFTFGYLACSFLAGDHLKKNAKLAASFLLGTFLTTWLVFIVSLFGLTLDLALISVFLIINFLAGLVIFQIKKAHLSLSKLNLFDACLIAFCLLASSWIMTKTLSHQGSLLKIGADVWGDMELHFPLARSFAWGENIPPESPFFPNQNLAYHFLFDLTAGILIYLGMKLDVAFNFLGTISLAALLILIFELSQLIFKKGRLFGILSIILFFFNSSFGFLDALRKLKPQSLIDFIEKVWQNNQYLSVNPFQNDLVSICWNLNVYVNQRHLIFAIGFGLMFLFWLISLLRKPEKNYLSFVVLGLLWGMLPFWYAHIFIGLGLVLTVFFVIQKASRKPIFTLLLSGMMVAIPQIFWMTKDIQSSFAFQPGFLATKPLTLKNFISYWLCNLGLSSLTIPIGFLISSKKQKQLFLSFFSIFLIANLFQFNKEMFNNHKFFNFWLILANFYTASLLILLMKKGLKEKILAIVLLLFLCLSGIIDFMVIKNESFLLIQDYPDNQVTTWLKNHTPPQATFLTLGDEMYHPVRMAGRKTFEGWPRYAWAYGYDIEARKERVKNFFKIKDVSLLKVELLKNGIDYIMIPNQIPEGMEIQIDYPLWQDNFKSVYKNQKMEIFTLL